VYLSFSPREQAKLKQNREQFHVFDYSFLNCRPKTKITYYLRAKKQNLSNYVETETTLKTVPIDRQIL